MAQVDVIIPVYNTKIAYVRQALDSVIAQSFQDWQAVVVNDGSAADYSRELESLLSGLEDSRIVYVKSENRGLPAARNLGISSSNSPFVALLDSDDAWYPEKLARQLREFEQHPGVSLVHGSSDRLMGDDMSGLRRITPRTAETNDLSREDAVVRMLQGNFVEVCTAMFRRSDGESVGLFDASFRSLEDKEFWIRLLLAGFRFRYIPETLAIYRVHSSNMSKDAEKMLAGRMKLIEKVESQIVTGPEKLRRDWKNLRAMMVRHARQEAIDTYLESRRHLQAIRMALPWRTAFTTHSAYAMTVATLGLLGLRR